MNKTSLLIMYTLLYSPYLISMLPIHTADLYQGNLTKKKIKTFAQENVSFTHKDPYHGEFPIIYWMKKYDIAYLQAVCQYQADSQISGEIKTNLKKQLSLIITFFKVNAIPIKDTTKELNLNKFNQDFCALYPRLLWYPVLRKDYTKIEKLLRFKPKNNIKVYTFWQLAIQSKHDAIIDLLITNFTKEEIGNALEDTVKITFDSNIMEKLINHGADCNKPLSYLYNILSNHPDDHSINQQKSYQFLCSHGAFNQEVFDNFQKKATFYNNLVKCMNTKLHESSKLDTSSSESYTSSSESY